MTNIEWHCSGCDEKDKRIKRLEKALQDISAIKPEVFDGRYHYHEESMDIRGYNRGIKQAKYIADITLEKNP